MALRNNELAPETNDSMAGQSYLWPDGDDGHTRRRCDTGSEPKWTSAMRCSVKLLTAGILALSVGIFSAGVQATEACYKLNPFVDVLKLEFGPLTNGHRNVYGNWIAPGYY